MTTFSKVKAGWMAALALAVLLSSAALAVTQQDQGRRAISGGTGPFAAARGEATQTMLGFNQLNGVKLRFTIRVVTR